MIRFALRCRPAAHRFEAWFRSGADFERQAAAGLVACPTCDSVAVEKALMAPAVGTTGRTTEDAADRGAGTQPEKPGTADGAATADAPPADTGEGGKAPADPAAAYRKLQTIARELRRKSENVGPRFAEEARRMHAGESDRRSIYGEASKQEVESLQESGITPLPLPPLPEDGH